MTVRWLMVAMLLVAFGLRVLGIYDLPPGFAFDEGFYGLDAASVLTGNILPFYPANGGREGLFMWLVAPFIAVLGHDALALRLPTAYLGVATVAATYPFARRLFQSAWPGMAAPIGLITAGLTCGSLFLILLNRIGLRASAYPLLLAVAGYWFWRAYEDGRGRSWVIAGLTFGITEYTYTGARVLPAVIPGYLAARAILDLSLTPLLVRWRGLLLFTLVGLATIAPLAGFAITRSAEFNRRQDALSPLNEAKSGQPFLVRYASALAGTLPMFFIRGDEKIFRNLPGKTIFDPPIAVFFVAGLAVAGWRVLRRGRPVYAFVLLWIVVMIAAAAIPLGVVPHNVHALGIFPVIFVAPAIGMVVAAEWLRQRVPMWAMAAAAMVLVAGSGALSAYQYFGEWARYPDTFYQFDGDVVDIVNAMNDLGNDPEVAFVIVTSRFNAPEYRHGTIDFLYRGRAPFSYVRVDDETVAASLAAAVGDNRRIVRFERSPERDTPPDNRGVVDWLLTRQGRRVADEFRPGFRMTTYQVDGPLLTDLAPGSRDVAFTFGGLTLDRVGVGTSRDSRSVWAVLGWTAASTLPADLKASIRLERAGQTIALSDRDLLRAPLFEPTSKWERGDREASYHLIDLPVGTIPGTYDVQVLLYEAETGRPIGEARRVGSIQIDSPAMAPGIPEDLAIAPVSAAGVTLVGRALPEDEIAAGSIAPVGLIWRGERPLATTLTLRVIDDTGNAAFEQTVPLSAAYPPDRWRSGQIVRDDVALAVPLTVPAGDYRVEARWGGDSALIGDLSISNRARTFTLPPIARPVGAQAAGIGTLAGWDASRAGDSLTVSLIWQATATADRNWTAFVHVIDATGRIVAQHDAPPAAGTASWVAGEVIRDDHILTLPAGGPYRVRTGLYDPATNTRVSFGSADSVDLGPLPN